MDQQYFIEHNWRVVFDGYITINIINITELIHFPHDFQCSMFQRYEQQVIIRNIEQVIITRIILTTYVQHDCKYVLLWPEVWYLNSKLSFPTTVVVLLVSMSVYALSPSELNRRV